MSRIALLLLGFLLLPSLCIAEDACPWINRATAFGILADGKPTPESTSESTATSCTFTYRGGRQVRMLQVVVSTEADAHGKFQRSAEECASQVRPIAGIGNEAATCLVKKESAAQAFEALGRVRDAVFTITISTTSKNDALLTPALASKAITIATGQVAGNLY